MSSRVPSYRLHKASGQAVVTLNSKDFYLGQYGTPESRNQYNRKVAEWLANGCVLPQTDDDFSIAVLILRYHQFAQDYYRRPDGSATGEADAVGVSMRQLKALYGTTAAREFSPLKLKTVRQEMVKAKLCRNEVNKRTRRIVRMFAWAVENELLPASVHHALKAVAGLKRGRTTARESEPVRPVSDEHVAEVKKHVLPEVAAMVDVQLLTGMRPGEVSRMRICDIDQTAEPWIYTPVTHKTQHHGHERRVVIGPKAQAIIRDWLAKVPESEGAEAYLFSPKRAMLAREIARRAARKTKIQPSQKCRKKPSAKRKPAEFYSVCSYRCAIARACEKAGIPHWHPHQLRHSAGTKIRKEFGLDAARTVLGQRSVAVAAVYAEADQQKAVAAMSKVG